MPQNKQSHRHSLCTVKSHVVLFAYPIKLNIWIKNTVTKILPKKYVNLSYLSNAIKKILDKISFHRHFKHIRARRNDGSHSDVHVTDTQ